MRYYFVYILASKKNGTLYIGVTNNLLRRVKEHKDKIVKGLTEKYGIDKLIYYEEFSDPRDAIGREKQLKNYSREKKEFVIKERNPEKKDLFNELVPY